MDKEKTHQMNSGGYFFSRRDEKGNWKSKKGDRRIKQ